MARSCPELRNGEGGIHDIAYRRVGRWEAFPIYEAIFGVEEDLGGGGL